MVLSFVNSAANYLRLTSRWIFLVDGFQRICGEKCACQDDAGTKMFIVVIRNFFKTETSQNEHNECTPKPKLCAFRLLLKVISCRVETKLVEMWKIYGKTCNMWHRFICFVFHLEQQIQYIRLERVSSVFH